MMQADIPVHMRAAALGLFRCRSIAFHRAITASGMRPCHALQSLQTVKKAIHTSCATKAMLSLLSRVEKDAYNANKGLMIAMT